MIRTTVRKPITIQDRTNRGQLTTETRWGQADPIERDAVHEARCRQCGHNGLEYVPLVTPEGARMPLSVCPTCGDSREV